MPAICYLVRPRARCIDDDRCRQRFVSGAHIPTTCGVFEREDRSAVQLPAVSSPEHTEVSLVQGVDFDIAGFGFE